jgi:hypothetical protein
VQLAQLEEALLALFPGIDFSSSITYVFGVNQELVAESSLPVLGNQTLAIQVTTNHCTDQILSVDQNNFRRPVTGNACYGAS